MATHDRIFEDAAANIVTLAKKVLKEKDPDAKAASLSRMKYLEHEADLCLDLSAFIKDKSSYIRDGRNPIADMKKKLRKCVQIAENSCNGVKDAMSDFMDEDFFEAFFSSVEKNAEDIHYIGRRNIAKVSWLGSSSSGYVSYEPRSTTDIDDKTRIDNVTEPLARIAEAAYQHRQKRLNILMGRAN